MLLNNRYNIGQRIIEEFLCRYEPPPPKDFKMLVDAIAKNALKLFLGITAEEADWNETNTECLLGIILLVILS